MTDAICTLNAGSSSLKFAAYPDTVDTSRPMLRGKIAGIGNAPAFSAYDANDAILPSEAGMVFEPSARHYALIPALLD